MSNRTAGAGRVLILCLAAIVLTGLAPAALAQGVLNVQIVNGYNLVVDSNVTSPSTYAPSAAYIGARVCNTGNATLENVFAYAGDYKSGVGSMPGLFPVYSSAGDTLRPHLTNTGTYSLTLEGGTVGTSDASRFIGRLAAGECRMQYWLISYPQCVNVGGNRQSPPCSTSITGGIKPDDDLSLNYDIWATTTSSVAAPKVSARRAFTLRNEISAAANKIWPNTAAKVPDEYLNSIQSVIGWGTLGPDGQPLTSTNPVYPGQRVITTQGIWYDLGNVSGGFDNNGDLVPDQNAWLQPVGDAKTFDAGCFRMVNVYGIVIVKLKSGGEKLIPFQNQLYFENLPDNTGVVGLVYYQFIATRQGCSASMTPYQEAASGFDNEKFSSDFGLSNPLVSGSFGTNVSFSKTDGVPSTSPGSTLTYSVSAINRTGYDLGAPDLGVPLIIREKIPTGTTYQPDSVSVVAKPSGSGSYTFNGCVTNFSITSSEVVTLFSTDGGTNWTTTDGGAATTDIQWMLFTRMTKDGGLNGATCVAPDGTPDVIDTSLPAGPLAGGNVNSLGLSFRVSVATTGTPPVICNTATVGFGSSSASTATDCTVITGVNTVSGTVFKDDGTGGGVHGNGTIDGTEGGIGSGVSVALYYDANNDGALDANDILYGTTTTSAAGAYTFTQVPDGPFLVVLKKYDGPTSNGINDAVSDAVYGISGWGNTTSNPDLPLTTDQGILKLSESSTSVILAVNVDFLRDSGAQTVSNVNFGFAPPLALAKAVANNPDLNADGKADIAIDEGDVFNYSITLENRLPSVGRQGPSGCEYTVWAPTGSNGNTANKQFTDPTSAWDGPNRTTATALVTGGGLREISGTGFSLRQQPGNITKVEALFLGYFGSALTDDLLNLTATRAASSTTRTLNAALIDSFVGPPADLDPNSAIPWDLTNNRPGGGAWSWADNFSAVSLTVNPAKATSADQKTFFLDAIGLRITTDQNCVAAPSTTLSPVPLQDRYDTGSFSFVSASPTPTSIDTATGTIRWNDVGSITPGASRTVTVTMKALNVEGTRVGACGPSAPPALNSVCNWAETAFLTNNVYYADGRLATDATANVAANLQGKGEIRGTVWSDTNQSGWPLDAAEPKLPNVSVTLWGCVQSSGAMETAIVGKTCTAQTNGNSWQVIATATTDAAGAYEFIGLDTGYYLVEIGNTDNAPGTGNAAPFGATQTAEALDTQAVTGTTANGATCGTCNNTWGNPAANLNALNLLNSPTAEEKINGVNFGYYNPNATIYGNVWWDVNGNGATVSTPEPGESGVSGFTVQLYTSGNVLVATTTSDASGNYSFGGLPAGSYVVRVTPPSLMFKAWVQTVETSPTGTVGMLDHQIAVTVTAGAFSGPHNFGYTQSDISTIGDTLFFDLNSNGIQDPNETGIPNVTVWLYADLDRDGVIDAGTDTIIRTASTNGAGKYLFQNLPSGSYIVRVDRTDPDFPSDVTPTADPDLNLASISGTIYLDANADGSPTGDDGISRVIVRLYSDVDASGTLNAADEIVTSAITETYGRFLFTGLTRGGYFVQVDESTLPPGGLQRTSTDPAATLISLASNAVTQTGSIDVGYSLPTNFTIGNRVWHDVNGNGVQDLGEPGIPNVDVVVTNGAGGSGCAAGCRTSTTAGGFWYVSGLTAGSYSVTVDTADTDFPRSFTLTAGTNPRTVTVTTTDLTNVDFGFRFTGTGSSPTGTINGRVYQDANANNTYDVGTDTPRVGTIVTLINSRGEIAATTNSGADGTYAFNGVFVGTYTVEARDALGRRFSTIFLSAAETFPNLNVIYNVAYGASTSADDQSSVSVDGVRSNLLQDFAYKRFLASIGDTVFHDVNENGTQDFGEPGFANVTVRLYKSTWTTANDANGDGFYTAGEGVKTLIQTTTTSADNPTTSADEGGKYLFANLPTLASGERYLVEVDVSTIGGVGTTKTQIADPDTDGTPCTQLVPIGSPGYEGPPPSVCDNSQLVFGFLPGTNYLGADFGYRITGPGYASFGDQLWIDTQVSGETGYGVRDSYERGIAAITIWIDSNGNGVFNWTDGNSNGVWDNGEGDRWTSTDLDGFYAFTNLADGTYDVRVLTTDPDWPSSTLLPSYEARTTNTASVNGHVQVVISGGVVTAIVDGDPATTDTTLQVGTEVKSCGTEVNCNLQVDFGYRYQGTDSFSGTLCIDDSTNKNGFCGASATTYNGVTTNETALQGLQVSLFGWIDTNNNGVAWTGSTLDPGDTFRFIGSRTTDANGDYLFSNVDLPHNVIAVVSLLDTQNLKLTTTSSTVETDPLSELLGQALFEATTEYEGNTVTVLARTAVRTGTSSSIETIRDADFAFELKTPVPNYDFGDLPTTYNASQLATGGARHLTNAASIRLGSTVTAEADGWNSANASADDDDFIASTVLPAEFQPGATVTLSGLTIGGTPGTKGWLIAWIDFNGDGDFNDMDETPDPASPNPDKFRRSEMAINQEVTAGSTTSLTFKVPYQVPYLKDDGTEQTPPSVYFARFRLYTSQPAITSMKGVAVDSTFNPMGGEVEDYMFTASIITAVQMGPIDARQGKKQVTLTWKTTSESNNLGFHVYRQLASGERQRVNKHLIQGTAFKTARRYDTTRTYRFIDKQPPAGFVQYYLEDVDINGTKTLHGPVTPQLTSDEPPVTTEPDPTLGSVGGIFTSAPGIGVPIPAPPAPAAAQLEEQWKLAAVPAVKVVVTKPGWYSVKKSDLVAAGFDPGNNAKVISVFTDGVEVPVLVTGKNPAQFTDADTIEFFGRGIDTPGTGGRVYYITPRKGSGARIKSVGGKGNSGSPTPAGFPYSFERIERTVFFSGLVNNGDRENFLGAVITTDPVTQSITVSNRDTTASTAELELVIQGATENLQNVIEVNLNGRVIGDARLRGMERAVVRFSVPSSTLADGENTLTLTARNGWEDVSVLESLRLTYSHQFRADEDALAVRVAGGTAVTVGGFTKASVRVVDITDPAAPTFIDATVSAAKDGTHQVSFATTGQETRTIFAFADTRVLTPPQIAWNEPSTWNAKSNGAKLVILTNRAFVDAAKKLAKARQDQGIHTVVVDVQNVYDEFSYGHHGPQAIRDFLAHASANWTTKPRYVVLLGDASYDPRDYYGFGNTDYVPTKLVPTTYKKTASDDWFGDFANTGVPSLAIGRLPVRTAAEADGVVSKLIARNAPPSAPWARNVDVFSELATDYPFDLDADAIAQNIPGRTFTVHRTRLQRHGAASAVANAFQRGSLLMTYVGHGSVSAWNYDALSAATAAELTNRDRAPFVIALNCLNGQFEDSWEESLAEGLINNPSGGAIGVWASSAMSTSPAQVALSIAFNRAVFGPPNVPVGDAIIQAKQAVKDLDVRRSWIFFGDPTMPLR